MVSVRSKYSMDSPNNNNNSNIVRSESESKSTVSHKSNRSTSARSSVLERARAYTRKLESESPQQSLERESPQTSHDASNTNNNDNDDNNTRSKSLGRQRPDPDESYPRSRSAGRNRTSRERAMASVRNESPNNNSKMNPSPDRNQNGQQQQQQQPPSPPVAADTTNHHQPTLEEAVVSPELLVDALSGHEDGLLAIAEKLMEHYDRGYDVMGEAIIDAFADVQKLFQHVVEAAHMEGAAFESSRREAEMQQLKKRNKDNNLYDANNSHNNEDDDGNGGVLSPQTTTTSPSLPSRHDEFIDQDVKDSLTEGIRNGAPLRDSNNYMECYKLYEAACQNSSSLLPVDSDHRGRLQLSIARAESMTPDRACAILRYAMDDVLRSGLRYNINSNTGNNYNPANNVYADLSKRGDCVLDKPKDHPSTGMNSTTNGPGGSAGVSQPGVIQSSEEALASLVEELKEVLNAPIYDNTPLQSVAQRFWLALGDAQRFTNKNSERLEHNLGKLKGEFLLARAEWEEKLNHAQDSGDVYKKKYMRMKELQRGEHFMEQARSTIGSGGGSHGINSYSDGGGQQYDNPNGNNNSNDNESNSEYNYGSSRNDISINSMRTTKSARSHAESIASIGSGLAHQAKSVLSCAGLNEHTSDLLRKEGSEQNAPYAYRRTRSASAPRSPRHNHNPIGLNSRTSSTSSRTSSKVESERKSTRKSKSFNRLQQEV